MKCFWCVVDGRANQLFEHDAEWESVTEYQSTPLCGKHAAEVLNLSFMQDSLSVAIKHSIFREKDKQNRSQVQS